MLGIKFCPEQDEQWINQTVHKIKTNYRPLYSLKSHWIIDKTLPEDTVTRKWRYRGLQEIDLNLASAYTTKEGLERLLWHELTHVYDELNPWFKYNFEYFKKHYGPGGTYERYYNCVHAVWDVWIDGRLHRANLPVADINLTQIRFEECFPLTKESGEWFYRLYDAKGERTFQELEDIAKKLCKVRRETEKDKEENR